MVVKTKAPRDKVGNNHGNTKLDSNRESANLSESQRMQDMLTFAKLPAKEAAILRLISKIPFFEDLLGSINNTGETLGQLATVQGHISHALETANGSFQYSDLALNIIDFFRIPAVYLASAIVGEKPPITLSKNARWLYAAVSLGLTIAALAIPAAAPPIALALASAGLSLSLVTMAKTLYSRYKVPKDLKAIEEDITKETKDLNELHRQAIELDKKLATANSPEQKDEIHQELKAVTGAFDALFKSKKDSLQQLYDKKYQCEAILEKHNTPAVMDKGIGIALSALALAGLTLSLFFPPLGLGLLAASAIAGGAYLVGRMATPYIKTWTANLFGKKDVPDAVDTPANQPTVSPSIKHQNEVVDNLDISLKTEPIAEPIHESTTTTMKLLFGNQGAATALHRLINDSQSIEETQKTLSVLVKNHDLTGILTFFSKASLYIQTTDQKITTEDLNQFFSVLDEQEPLVSLLKQAVSAVQKNEIQCPEHDKQAILACKPLVDFLHEKQIGLNGLTPEKERDTTATPAAKIEHEEPHQN